MQTVSTQFNNRAAGDVRPLGWRLRAAFDKVYNEDVDFFTIEESEIGGTDFIAPEDSEVIQEWDKYTYEDYSDRLMGFEWTREAEEPSGITLAMADIELRNNDKLFAPETDYSLPGRPFRLYAGFKNENPPQFVGVNEKVPEVIASTRTAKFHLVDFLSTLMNRPLNEAVILEDVSTDEVLDYLFQLVGLLPTQYELDGGFNTISFVYIEPDAKLGAVVRQLMEAEQGRLFMDELGVIRFWNRQHNYGDSSVMTFNKSNTNDYQASSQEQIINAVEVKSQVREVQALQKYWELSQPVRIPAGETVEVWANFDDPVTTVDTPALPAPDITSMFSANTLENGEGVNYTDISLDSFDLFAKSYKMTFENTGASEAYIRVIELWATPAKIVKEIFVREIDQASIDKYDEQVKTIENNFIQTDTEAQSRALQLVESYSELGGVLDIDVKGNPALQLGDILDIDLDDNTGTYAITRLFNRYLAGKFTQLMRVKRFTPTEYFTIEVSEIEGTDQIAP